MNVTHHCNVQYENHAKYEDCEKKTKKEKVKDTEGNAWVCVGCLKHDEREAKKAKRTAWEEKREQMMDFTTACQQREREKAEMRIWKKKRQQTIEITKACQGVR